MPLFGNGIDKATAEVRRLKEARAKLETRELAAREELERLRAALPGIALADILGEGEPPRDMPGGLGKLPGTTPSYNRILALDLEIRTCVDAVPAIFPRLEAALKAVNVARASEIRKRAEKVQIELSEHKIQVERLREQLWSIEGAQYVPAPMQWVGDLSTGAPIIPSVTKTARLTQQRDELLAQADQIEGRNVNRGGGADAPDLDGLLAAVAAVDDNISPTERAIRSWFEQAQGTAERDWQRNIREEFDPRVQLNRRCQIMLVWRKDGEISDESRVRFTLDTVERAAELYQT